MAITLSKSERLMLINQYAILRKLDPENEKDYGCRQRILERGYSSLYSELGHIEEELPATLNSADLTETGPRATMALPVL